MALDVYSGGLGLPDRDYYLDSMHAVNESVATEGYSRRLERHISYNFQIRMHREYNF